MWLISTCGYQVNTSKREHDFIYNWLSSFGAFGGRTCGLDSSPMAGSTEHGGRIWPAGRTLLTPGLWSALTRARGSDFTSHTRKMIILYFKNNTSILTFLRNPPGLPIQRQWHIFNQIREFVLDDTRKDTVCLEPTVSLAILAAGSSQTDPTEQNDEPQPKRAKEGKGPGAKGKKTS